MQIGEKISKAPIIFTNLYRKQISSLLDIPEIRQSLKEQLMQDFSLALPRLIQQTNGTDTIKFLFALQDENLIEAVLIFFFYLSISRVERK